MLRSVRPERYVPMFALSPPLLPGDDSRIASPLGEARRRFLDEADGARTLQQHLTAGRTCGKKCAEKRRESSERDGEWTCDKTPGRTHGDASMAAPADRDTRSAAYEERLESRRLYESAPAGGSSTLGPMTL